MEERYYLANEKLRRIVSTEVDPRESLVRLSRYVLQAVELSNPCFAYVIPYRRLGLSGQGYLVAIFLKDVLHRRLAVFDTGCFRSQEALAYARKRLSSFGLYLFNSRFVCDLPWQKG